MIKRLCLGLSLLATFLLPFDAAARGHHYGYHASTHHTRTAGATRDRHGRIARSGRAKVAFKRSSPCPSTGKSYGACPGFVIDHVKALKHGGVDAPSNMQWQTKADAKAKDKWE